MESQKFGDKVKSIAQGVEFFAGQVEKFVESNFIEKEQRDQNLKKLGEAVDKFVKDRVGVRVGFNDKVRVAIKPLDHFKGEWPKYESAFASGVDVRAQLENELTLQPGERTLVPTGLSFEIPEGFEIQARPRSGWAIRQGLTLLNTPGTIDADYRGEVKIIVVNLGQEPITIADQDRVAQLVLAPVVQADFFEKEELSSTERGSGGFGSTGKQASEEGSESSGNN